MIINKSGRNYLFDEGFTMPNGSLHVDTQGYLGFDRYLGNRKSIRTLLHRYIMNAPDGVMVDHINGDIQDNRKANLRLVTAKENTWNRLARGCTKHKTGKWQSTIESDGKNYYLGLFNTPEEASAAYRGACRVLRHIQPRIKEVDSKP
jgi:hypothetical protein